MKYRTLWLLAAGAASLVAQQPPETILTIDFAKLTWYYEDTADPRLRGASLTAPTMPTFNNFVPFVILGDLVTVNGTPAKGTCVGRGMAVVLRDAPTGAQAIGDVIRSGYFAFDVEVQQQDGTPIGSFHAVGLHGGTPPLGSPAKAGAGNFAVVGGTGAYFGATGDGATYKVDSGAFRTTTMSENPINRRTHHTSAGLWGTVFHLIPKIRPEVATVATGPAIFHGSDFSPVTAEKPARAGELLVLGVSGLGPVKGKIDPGQPFPEAPPLEVNSPIEVTVNGKPAPIVNKLGWPGTANLYRVDFTVPDGTQAGTASLQVSAAWIPGAEVKFRVQ